MRSSTRSRSGRGKTGGNVSAWRQREKKQKLAVLLDYKKGKGKVGMGSTKRRADRRRRNRALKSNEEKKTKEEE